MESRNHDELVSQFCGVTGAPASTAQTALASTNWNLEEAVTVFYASLDAPPEADVGVDADSEGDVPQPIPTTSSSSSSRPTPTQSTNRAQQAASRMRTIRDLNDGSGSDSEDEAPQDFFAGGEKSGLAVQDPNRGQRDGAPDYFNNLINQARQNAARPDDDDQPAPTRSSAFSGRAQTLGGDDAPSQIIEDPTARAASSRPSLPRAERTLHLWQDGFSIDDGPLHRFDDPANAPVLEQIHQGRAPLALLGVQPGQEVDLNLDTHKDQNYVAPKKKYKPFGGQGQRLGSPTPGPSTAAAPPPQAQPAAASAASASASSSSQPTVTVDDSAPVITLQIRLGDGTRLQSRFNTTHTIGDVYDFVSRANVASTSRSYSLMTTFPSKDLADKSVALGDMAEFKRGGVIVQKWT